MNTKVGECKFFVRIRNEVDIRSWIFGNIKNIYMENANDALKPIVISILKQEIRFLE